MTGQPLAASAVALVRDSLRLQPIAPDRNLTPMEELDELEKLSEQSREWGTRVYAAVEHLSEHERFLLITALARLGGYIALQIPERERNLFLSLMAGVTEEDS